MDVVPKTRFSCLWGLAQLGEKGCGCFRSRDSQTVHGVLGEKPDQEGAVVLFKPPGEVGCGRGALVAEALQIVKRRGAALTGQMAES